MTNIITGLFSFIDVVWTILQYIIVDIGITISLIVDPMLFIMVILIFANIYVVLKSRTRKELVLNYGGYFSMIAVGLYYIAVAIIPVLFGIISGISNIITGILSAPPVTVAGTGVAPGTLLAIAIVVLLLAFSIVSI